MAIAVNRAFHNAGWAWAKLVSGVLIFEWGLVGIQGPMQQEAELSAHALAGSGDVAALAASIRPEEMSLWILLVVTVVNVMLGIWRPRLTKLPD
jgi:hypothetical protein